jgi:hypothetical protein
MGALIIMRCSSCNYESNPILLGSTFTVHSMKGPALDLEAEEVVEIDYDEWHDQPDSNQIPYFDLKLRPKIGLKAEDDLIRNYSLENDKEITLSRKNNFCPACNAFSLDLETLYMVD